MDKAYCPYCGELITVRGQSCCPHCSADIIDIWKLLNSNLQAPSLVRPAPSQPRRFDWIGPAFIITLGLALFALAAYLALPWLADTFLPGSSPDRAGEFIPPGSAGSIGAPVAGGATPTPLPLSPTPTAAPMANDPLLADGQVVSLKCLGHLEGKYWLSGDAGARAVFLTAEPDDPGCQSCWRVINPDRDGVVQLALLSRDSPEMVLKANPGIDKLWVSEPDNQSPAQDWLVVLNENGSVSLLSQVDGPARWLNGKTVEGQVALAPQPDAYYTGAYWEVQPVSQAQLDAFYNPPQSEESRDPCLAGSRLAVGEKAAVIEGSGRNRLRKNPSLSARIIELIPEGDPVKILDGPECNDGLVWWRVRVLETGATGWTAEMRDGDYYLRPLD